MSEARHHEALRFVLVSRDELARLSTKRHLTDAGHRVIGESEDLKSGLRLVRGLQPDVALLEMGSNSTQTIEAVERLHEEMPALSMVLLSQDTSPQLILGCMRAGAQEFLTMPLDMNELDRAVDRIRKSRMNTASGSRRRGRLMTVYPAKGGVGASSVATNLALSLTSDPTIRVCLVDFNLQVGDLALMLDLHPEHSFARAVEDGTLDEGKLETILTRHRSGLRLLTVSDRPEESDMILRNHVPELFGLLNTMFDVVVADVGRNIDERTIELLDLSDDVLVVSALDVPTIRNTRRYLDLLERLEIPRDRVRLVVNRFEEKSRVGLRDLENTVGMEAHWCLPNDYRPMSAAIDSGNPVVLDSPRSRLSRSYRELGEALQKLRPGAVAVDDDDAADAAQPMKS
jgi:pilus assembly protein CpaE